jgi:GT2 family glycosyltransferase
MENRAAGVSTSWRPEAERPDVTVTIVSWNTSELLRACLLSLPASAARCSYEVHVVDNASTDGSVRMVRAEFPDVVLLESDVNEGFARANNRSWALARGRYWFLLNSDAEVRPFALDRLVEFMDDHPEAGLATARLVNPDGSPQPCAELLPGIRRTLLEATRLQKLWPAERAGHLSFGSRLVDGSPTWTYDAPIEVGWTWGTALMARREAVADAGALDGSFFMYGEDLEWCLRVRRHGWRILFCPDAEALHWGQQSSVGWAAATRRQRLLDGNYRALERHRGRAYVKVLLAAQLLSLSVDWVAARVRRRSAPERALFAYSARSLARPSWRMVDDAA